MLCISEIGGLTMLRMSFSLEVPYSNTTLRSATQKEYLF